MNPWPGTMQQCTHCAKHNERFNGSQGWRWFYCDSICEAKDIVPCVEGKCHWYSPGSSTHRTPLVGIRQALYLGWKPGPVDSPDSGPVLSREEAVEKADLLVKLLKVVKEWTCPPK